MLLALSVLALGVALRQVDRAWFATGRPRTASAGQLLAHQRSRANDTTPALLLIGQWTQIVGWWLLAAEGPFGALIAAFGVAVQFRHLQEVSHFAVHGVLARTSRANHALAETFVHHPMALGPARIRRIRHVREHHPNATVTGVDPNLAELEQAGLRPGLRTGRLVLALLHPLTVAGMRTTVRTLRGNLLDHGAVSRVGAVVALLVAAHLTGGWQAVVFGVLVPRLLLYPQLAWFSLFVEHTWFDPDPRSGPPAWTEAGRCLRLYPRNPALALLALGTWLPYGDLYHYAHSAHPGMRWNYLRAFERALDKPHFLPNGLALGSASVLRRHRNALTRIPSP
ncbi:Fatty acid desaturase [Streptomyces sp. Ncost-T6T-1]|uniref:dihydrouridine synthase n=1 Tax=Streptomyces sp. Ncost-T6T-1 TaxID=1100828 RepID=UPI000804EF24|nr:dihydrouridine synthase [Streptomyces sp. Ncost-T6T-1]SBV00596.1 Fatty acid desaturase [Streptomyces sp. Ncost-T6T-1]